ncbi:nucleotide-diphospho-sugar transferase [Xylariomycetidae sp. FL2044]|nr:nucleotide-diphospho-sugar transferase [Xylariomycetidae sp. FL2044]
MGLQRTRSVKVADVRVPQRLLSTTRKHQDWSPHSHAQQILNENGPVQDAFRSLQRSSSVASTSWRGQPAVTGDGIQRRTSDPVTRRETASVHHSRTNSRIDLNNSSEQKQTEAFPLFDNPFVDPPASRRSGRSPAAIRDRKKRRADGPKRRPEGTERQYGRDLREGQGTRQELERKRWVQILFEYGVYVFLLAFIYFVLVGLPLWKGAVYWMYWLVSTKFVIAGGWSILMGVAIFYAFGPLLIMFEKEPPPADPSADFDRTEIPGVATTALLIPCYKSANIIGPTLEASLKIFPPSHIFVIANGNSPTPLDHTEQVCRPYGVNHIWSPVGSKIVAQFVGCHAARNFQNVLLIDDDCALPPNFPVVSERLAGKVQSIGYTIKSVGPGSSKGTWCQQAQDLEYKISGLQRAFAGILGSATFPHGAISLWNRNFLIQTFHDHPGFSVSEDWFFGHSCRRLGGRIKMCTSVFVETETPDAIFFSSGGSRGGFGEMTVFKQRFLRWNFFFVNGMWYNLHYILCSWKMGFWEIGAKLFVFQEVYETLLYLFTPFILPISFIVEPSFCGYLLLGTIVMYFANVVVFNEWHLRRRNERISWTIPFKLILTLVNVASCYWSLFKYAQYFAKRHPKVVEDEKAVEVVMRLEEELPVTEENYKESEDGGRRMFLTTSTDHEPRKDNKERIIIPASEISAMTSPKRLSFVLGADEDFLPRPSKPSPVFSVKEGVQTTDFAQPESSHATRDRYPMPRSASWRSGRRRSSWSESMV